ncbi:hypothetical protein D3C80_1473090 [compost metagenome]
MQGFDLLLAQGQAQIDAVGGELFVQHQAVGFSHAQFQQRQFAEAAAAGEFAAADQQAFFGLLQALVGATAVGAGQAAGAQLDATVPADHQHHHLVTILGLDGREDRPPSGAAGFAVVAAAVLPAKLPGPAVVGGGEVAMAFDEVHGFGRAADWRSQGDEAALANLFAKLAGVEQGKRHKRRFSREVSGHSL